MVSPPILTPVDGRGPETATPHTVRSLISVAPHTWMDTKHLSVETPLPSTAFSKEEWPIATPPMSFRACYFHYLATPSRYPSATIGRMVGYANLLIAIVGDGPPYALAAFIQRGSFPSTESERYVFVHAGLMMGVVALSIALPGHLWWAARVRTQRLRFSTLRALHIASHMDPSRSKASSTRSFEMELGMAAVADEELPGSTASAGTERGEKVKLHVTCEGSDEVGFSDGFHDDGHRLTTRLP